ncbi:MAG TPA: hypothetical protein PLJ21_06960, partial [Pseudobdellovibrionaceae bacterium]|nr:hypothetical protein [Pseudobdellovibrionaceae bacterium]
MTNSNTNEKTNTNQQKPKTDSSKKTKPKFFLRLEAIIPFLILCGLVYVYFFLFFDLHLKKSLEYIGYQVNEAEVNIGHLSTSFTKASILIQNIEVTNPEAPEKNSVSIKKIEFKALWDAMLRARLVIDNIGVDGIQINTLRKRAGKLKPPPPPEPITTNNSSSISPLVAQEGQKLFSMGLNELEKS